MDKKRALAVLVVFSALGMAQKFSVEGGAGFYGGLGGQLAVVVEDLVQGLPLGLRLGVGFAQSDALDDAYDLGGGTKWGDFKNTNQLSEWGQNITLSADVLYKVSVQGLPVELAPYVGLRYNFFSGGSTDPQDNLTIKAYTVSSNQFGLGLGARLAYPLAPNLQLVGDLGADYFFKACIEERIEPDTGSPTSQTVCPGDTAYPNLDKFVTQPEWVLKLRLGLAYRF